jgi:hypothetical protein
MELTPLLLSLTLRLQLQKVSDDDNIDLKARDGVRSSTLSQVQAQDYERDILPRYKDALHIGLASCKDHFRKRGRSTTSVFRVSFPCMVDGVYKVLIG